MVQLTRTIFNGGLIHIFLLIVLLRVKINDNVSGNGNKTSQPYFILLSVPGLTYWRMNENELYHPLPDSFDSGAYLLLQEAPVSPMSKNQIQHVQ